MIQRVEGLAFTLEPREEIDIVRERFSQDLGGPVAIQFRVAGALDLVHAPAPIWAVISSTPLGVPGVRAMAVMIWRS